MTMLPSYPNQDSDYLDRSWLEQQFDVLYELVIRDVQLRYKNSLLGVAWSLANPVLQLAVYYVVFSFLLVVNIPHYAAYIFTGLLPFLWFQNSLMQAVTAITGNRALVKRPGFSPAILPFVTVTTNLIYFLLSLPILFIFLWFEGLRPQPSALAIPLLLAVQFVFTLGLGYLTAGANVVFRDTEHLLSVLMRLLFFLTPVFYSVNRLPDPVRAVYFLNPLAVFVATFRAILMGEAAVPTPYLFYSVLTSLVLLTVGYILFSRLRYRFAEEL